MSLKRKLICEIRVLLSSPVRIIIPCAAALVVGLLTWISCRGIWVIWRVSRHPPMTIPLPVMIFMWLAIYVLFGVIFRLSSEHDICSSLSLKTIVSYLATLFWCPLLMIAGNLICSVTTLILSICYLVSVIKMVGKYSLVAVISFTFIFIYELYMLYFSVVFAVIN